MGKAIIIPNISFIANNLGRVTFVDNGSSFYITALEDLTITFPETLKYNTKIYPDWNTYFANTELEIPAGTTVAFRGNLLPDSEVGGIGTFDISGQCNISGDLLALVEDNIMRDYEFKGLFKNCISIINARNLVLSDTLAEGCYEELFYGCYSLESAPILSCSTLEDNCYEKMFYNCAALNHIECYNLDDISDYVSSDWVYGVANSGTFLIDYTGDWDTTNKASHIPSGWNIDDDLNKPYEAQYLTIDIITGGAFTTIPMRENETTIFTTDNALSIDYKVNNGSWTTVQLLDNGITLNVAAGDKIKFRGTNTHYCNNTGSNIHKQWYVILGAKHKSEISGCTATQKQTEFTTTTATFNAYGNIMSLCYGDNFIGQTTLPATYTFCSLFKCSNIISAEHLILPATTLLASCYRAMFSWANNLTTSPILGTATPVSECYKYIFEQCHSLKKITCLAASSLNTNAFECWTDYCENTSNITFVKNANTSVDTSVGSTTWMTKSALSTPSSGNKFALIGSNWVVQDYSEN